MTDEADEVDEVLAAWAAQRPDLMLDPLQVWSRLTRLAAVLDEHRNQAFAKHGLEGWQFDVLAALRRSGEPYQLSPGQLIRETFVTSGTMTNRVDRLVRLGLVVRDPDPEDGRGVLVRLTRRGLGLVDAALVSLLAVEEQLLAGWQPQQRHALAGYLRRLLSSSRAAALARR